MINVLAAMFMYLLCVLCQILSKRLQGKYYIHRQIFEIFTTVNTVTLLSAVSFFRSIHLSNNAVQAKYDSQVTSANIPSHLMWSSAEFQSYLRQRGHDRLWDDVIYPGMRKAVLCALLCTQDIVEYRKVRAAVLNFWLSDT